MLPNAASSPQTSLVMEMLQHEPLIHDFKYPIEGYSPTLVRTGIMITSTPPVQYMIHLITSRDF